MKFALVPEEHIIEKKSSDKRDGSKSWRTLESRFANLPYEDAARSVIEILKEVQSVTMKNGLLTINNNKRSMVSAHAIVKDLCSSGDLQPEHRDFLLGLKASETDVPQANSYFILRLKSLRTIALYHCRFC